MKCKEFNDDSFSITNESESFYLNSVFKAMRLKES